MAYAKIPLKWADLTAKYKKWDDKDFPPEITKQLDEFREQDRKFNEKTKEQNIERAAMNPPKPPIPLRPGIHTSCVMQISLGINNTQHPLPRTGAQLRPNTYCMGQYMMLSVVELHDWLDWQYGKTDIVPKGDMSSIKGKKGILIMGSAHVELWNGDKWLQNMRGDFTSGPTAYPYYFWECEDGGSGGNVLPDWLVGWWGVTDGTQYYYHFAGSGRVTYIEGPKPGGRNAAPPKNPENVGKAVMSEEKHGPVVTWASVGGKKPTIEDYTQVNWTSETKMNGYSHSYGQLYAWRLD